jgi:hypothetical protein
LCSRKSKEQREKREQKANEKKEREIFGRNEKREKKIGTNSMWDGGVGG